MSGAWKNPLPLRLVASDDSLSFTQMKVGETALPLSPHPGAYGVVRKNHTHEGVDFYCPAGTAVAAVEAGAVVAVMDFTGPKAGSPWWHDTQAVMVEGASGVVLYGEIAPVVRPGDRVMAGQLVGHVTQVLREDKGRPMSMLHLELHAPGTCDCYEWPVDAAAPGSLRDPTPFLLPLAER
jgi:murein DD-endopeptidase MepM/ murein hydrolase activator NlpD